MIHEHRMRAPWRQPPIHSAGCSVSRPAKPPNSMILKRLQGSSLTSSGILIALSHKLSNNIYAFVSSRLKHSLLHNAALQLLPHQCHIHTYIHDMTSHYITLHYISLHYLCLALHYITLGYNTLHYYHSMPLHFTTLHCIT